jgi:hypothetical protein
MKAAISECVGDSSVLSQLDPWTRRRRVQERELSLVSRDFPGSKFWLLGSLMSVSKGRLEQIVESCPHNNQLQIQTLLFEWRQKNSLQATVEAFVTLMTEAQIDVDVYLPHISSRPIHDAPSLSLRADDHSEQFV